MTDHEIDRLVGEIQEMASRIGCDFIPDASKLKAFRERQRVAREAAEQYRLALTRR